MSTSAIDCDVLVIGAGVIGLAVAAELSSRHSVLQVEAYEGFGRETSSRNSEVIHSGIYYGTKSNKTKWCIAGRERLYEFCKRYDVGHQAIGKLVVATSAPEESYLESLAKHCADVAVRCEWLSSKEIQDREPLIVGQRALFFPDSGIVDSHSFMAALERKFTGNGGTVAYRQRVTGLVRNGEVWEITFSDGSLLRAGFVVNAAGLAAAELSNLALQSTIYEHRYCRGRYFTLPSSYRGKLRHLIYPVPPKDGLGVHVTLDLSGFARLGPDVDWCPGVDYAKVGTLYDCDWDSLRESFAAAARRYLPSVAAESLSPGLVGIRAKLFLGGIASPDFLVENHHGFIHCLGIESPGLTASLAIAEEVVRLLG